MINKFKSIARKNRRRKSLRKGRGTRSISRFRVSNAGPIIKIAGVIAAVAAFAVLVFFVIIPLFGGNISSSNTAGEVTTTPRPTPTPIASEDMSKAAKELPIQYNSINDPYIYGNEVVFSTGEADKMSPELKTIAVFNMETGEIAKITDITKNYNSLFEPKINEKYIVYLDCKTEYGGAICGFDRNTNERFVIREYLYGKPRVSLSGEYALWMQQTGNATDKLYLYHLPTRECVTIEVFVNTPFSVSSPFMSDEAIIYVQPDGENQILDGSSASMDAQICVIPLKENGDIERILFYPSTNVYCPMIKGDKILFLDRNRDESSRLMLCTKNKDTYTAPEAIAENVLNYCIGDGFVAYTKDEAVYVYYFEDQSCGRVSSETTRAMLSSVNGKDVVWYDITDDSGDSADVIMHISVP
ncbi:MAG: hypothetical protein ACOX8Q_07790 [Christensenellales bacterium]